MATATIYLPFTVSPALSGYTGKLTTFQFVLSSGSVKNPNTGNSAVFDTTKALWNFGDGTYSTSISSFRNYSWPGVYNVSVTLYDVDGTIYQNSFVNSITANNLLVDQLFVVPARKVLNVPAGRVSAPLRCDRVNSWQSYPSVSAVGYTLNFYASGSLSNKLNISSLATNKWSHVDRTWRFLTQVVDAYGNIQYIPIDSIATSNTELFYKIDSGTQQPIPCASTDLGSIFVGTSGSATFFYIDDTPKNFDSSTTPVFLYINLDTTRFPDSYQITSPEINSRTIFPDLEVFQHIRAIIPARIRYNAAAGLVFTSPGMLEIPISQHKWTHTKVPYFINLVDSAGFIVDNFPALTINTSLTATTAYDVVNVSLKLSGSPLSASFFDETQDGLPPAISATYRGFFVPYQTGDGVVLAGSVTVFNPPNIQIDTSYGWVVQPDTDSLYKIDANLASVFTFTSGGLVIDVSQKQNVFHTNDNHLFCIATAPSASADINVESYAWFGDANNDLLLKVDTTGAILSTISLSALLQTSSKLSPASIALDSNNNVWVGLYDAVSAIKIDGKTGKLLLGVVPTIANISYTLANQLSTFGGSNLFEPCAIDTDTNNDVWVAYGNPLSSYVYKYNGTTGVLLSAFGLTTGQNVNDLIVDNTNNVFVAAAFDVTGMSNFGIINLNSALTATKLSGSNGNFGKFKYTYASNISLTAALLAGRFPPDLTYVVQISGFADQNYNGRFLIDTFADTFLIVEPHPLAWFYAAQTVSVSATQSQLQSSDIVWRIFPNGTQRYATGFLNPSYLAVDANQGIWCSHHLARISKIDSTGTLIISSFTVGDAQYVVETVAQRNYVVTFPNRNLIELLVNYPTYRGFQHLEGLACDTASNIWVVNDFEGRIYYIPLGNMTLSAVTYTDFPEPLPGNYDLSRKTYQAVGDWNGFRWINKYAQTTSVQTVCGMTTFDVLPASGLYHIAKVNENFDAASTYKSFRFTERMLGAENLFNQYIGQVVGDVNADATTLGKLIYERIANFTANVADIETCVVTALYSICAELDIPIDNYQFLLPANLKRIFDLVSIKHSKLWGGRSKFAGDFNNRFSLDTNFAKNRGTQLTVATYMVSAGTNIIFNQVFNNEFKLVTPMVLSAFEPSGGLTTYPLSTYSPTWGWGLETGVTGIDLNKYYKVYSYVPTFDGTQIEGVIDWNNPLNTLVESNSSINAWVQDDGIIDTMLDWQIRKGLGLFDV